MTLEMARRFLKATTALIAASLVCAPAFAQQAAGAADTEATEEEGIEEIIVTALKREQRLQDVPLSIKAMTGDMLEALGADTFTDYARHVPSLTFAERGSGKNRIIIRGLSPVIGVPTVAFYLDGISTAETFDSPDPKIFDLDRIEILRGPQGTLYGEGALGGLIKVITNRPNPAEFEAKADVTFSTTKYGGENYHVNAMVNAPIVEDKFAIRAVGIYRNISGFIDAPNIGLTDANDEKTYGARISAKLYATENLSITAIYNFQDINFGIDSSDQPSMPRTSTAAVPVFVDSEENQISLEVEWNLGFADLSWIGGYNDGEVAQLVDLGNLFGLPPVFVLPGGLVNTTDIWNSELRLVSAQEDSRFSWVAGVFYKDRDRTALADFTSILPLFGFGLDIALAESSEQWAVFGEANYKITSKLSATVGLRYFEEDQSQNVINTTLIDIGAPEPLALVDVTEGTGSFDKLTPKFTLDYKVNEDVLVYATVANGYRSGGLNVSLVPDPNFQPTFEPDEVWNYELGLKSSWSENRLIINAAVFYLDWSNIQIDGIPGNAALGFITNGGSAHSVGFEVDVTAQPAPGLRIDLGGAYVEAETDEAFQGPKGQRLPNVPDFTFNASIQYDFPIFESYSAMVRADFSHRGDSFGDLPNLSRTNPDPLSGEINQSPSHEIFNLRAGIERDNWRLQVFADNLFNSQATSFAFTNVDGTGSVHRVHPRTIGINAKVNF